VLSEENGKRRIPIIIGGFEAQSIAIELEGLKPPRPLTHDGSDADIKGEIKTVSLEATDGSDLKAEFMSEEITCRIDEGSDAILYGETKYANVYASQGSDLDAFDLKTTNFSLKAYEGSDANIYVTNNLDVSAKGGSDVSVKGNPANKNVNVGDDSDISFR